MKIILIGTLSSGILGFRRDFIQHLVLNGHQVFAFAIDYNEVTKKKVEELGATPVDYCLRRTGMNPFSDVRAMLRLRRLILDISPEVVFSFFMKPVIYGSIAARLARVPKIVSMIEGLGYSFTPDPPGEKAATKKRLVRSVLSSLLRLAFIASDRVVLLNRDDKYDLEMVCGLNPDKARLLGPIGLNLKDYPFHGMSVESGTVRFVFVGRLLSEKGIREYLKAARLCHQKGLSIECLVLGSVDPDNPESIKEAELQEYVEDGSIVYPGFVNDVASWVSRAHVFVLPSYYREGVPRSTQEAMAIGRAVLTTNLPGCRDTVIDGENGFYVKPWDAADLALKMEWFVDNPDRLIEFGKRSSEIAQAKFDVRVVNENLMSILLE